MDEQEPRNEYEREPLTEREKHLPEHELRPETGVGGGVDPAGTSEEVGQVAGRADQRETVLEPEDVPPTNRSG